MLIRFRLAILPFVCLLTLSAGARSVPPQGTPSARLLGLVTVKGRIAVTVGVRDDEWRPEGTLSGSDVVRQRDRGRGKIADVIAIHPQIKEASSPKLETVPYFIASVNEGALRALLNDDRVTSIEEDLEFEPALVQSTAIIGATAAHSRPTPYTGSGQIVVIIDNGVDHTHPFLRDRVLHQYAACYSNVFWTEGDPDETVFDPVGAFTNACPNGQSFQEGETVAHPYPGRPCTANTLSNPQNPCHHGTKVAGVVAGSRVAMSSTELSEAPAGLIGVAPDTRIVPIAVAGIKCTPSTGTCTSSGRQSNVLFALDYVASNLNDAYPGEIAAVNLSVRFPNYYSARSGCSDPALCCDTKHPVFKSLVANIVSKGIAVVAATGNDNDSVPETRGKIGLPACISAVIAVSATTDTDTVASYANTATVMDLFAPGGTGTVGSGILTSQNLGCTGCDKYYEDAGTSMAAPHVAGAIALLRQRTAAISPRPSVSSLLGTLVRTGVMVTDSRNGVPPVTKPRINVNEALDQPLDLPSPTNVNADAVTTSSNNVTWSAPNTVVPRTTYRVRFRTGLNSSWVESETTDNLSHSHSGVTSGTVYQYDVATVDAAGNASPSNSDFALPLFFADDPIVSGVTFVRGLHVSQLREAVDAWRGFASLSPIFTYAPPTGDITYSDLLSIINGLNLARTTIGLSEFAYAVGTPAPGVGAVINRRHLEELRTAVH